MKTSDFYYDLPQELIAQTPLERRDSSRLMVLHRETGELEHRHFYDIVDYLQPGDCLVMNDSRVLPARLLGHRVPTGGAVRCWPAVIFTSSPSGRTVRPASPPALWHIFPCCRRRPRQRCGVSSSSRCSSEDLQKQTPADIIGT